ncbi:hypothetical protein Gotur_004504, partial [Gossypium turneri]
MAKTTESLSHLSTSSEASNRNAANGDLKFNAGASDKLKLDEACKVPLGKVIKSLNDLYANLRQASKLSPPTTAAGDPKPKDETSDFKYLIEEFDKTYNGLKYLIDEFEKLQKYETDLSGSLETIEKNVEDILGDLNANKDNVEWETTKKNLKVLRSNMTKVKAQLPLLNHMGKVIVSLNYSYENLKAKAPKLSSPATAAGDPKSKDETSDLDKACNELKYLIDEFKKLQAFETKLSDPLDTIEKNVDDVLDDLNANQDNVEWETTKDNIKVLRSNITKVKAQLPLLHQTSSSTEARRLLATTSREEASKLPSPYQADGIFEKGSFLKEFQDRYETLGDSEKSCLQCFAIFPENAEVSERLLRFWWEGEGDNLRPTSESATKKVNEILDEFVNRGFIEPVYKRSGSRGSCYKMHPIVRCLIVRLAKQANFFYYDSKGYPSMEFFKSSRICLVKSEGPSWWSKDVLAFRKEREEAQQRKAREQAQQRKDKKQAEADTMTKEEKKQKQKLEELEGKDMENRVTLETIQNRMQKLVEKQMQIVIEKEEKKQKQKLEELEGKDMENRVKLETIQNQMQKL